MKPDIHYLPRAHLQALIDALHAAGFRCVGPQAADGAIVYDTLTDAAQLPWGITQTQAPGHYRLHASDDARCFAWATGPQALKPLMFAPREAMWAARRAGRILVAGNCTHPAATCFCVSTGDGPRANTGYDLALTELDEGYLVETGSERGRAIAAHLPLTAATAQQLAAAAAAMQQSAEQQPRRLPGRALAAPLFANLHHPRRDKVATRS